MNLENVPKQDIHRSKTALRIGELAEENHLFLAHYEYRRQLEMPEAWQNPNFQQESVTRWEQGILAEDKYQSFRTDQRIGSFHAGHQAKWTSHELCHSLLGFAWQKEATLFYHATAARLAELLPVVQFYYYDEAFLKRCEMHTSIKFPYVAYCKDCELAASHAMENSDSNADMWFSMGDKFLYSELEAVKESLLKGKIIPNPNHKLDLASDGIAYAMAQQLRLNSADFAKYIDLFVTEKTGLTRSLDQFMDRILALRSAILENNAFPSYSATRNTWLCQDIGWRLIETQAQTEGELYNELESLILELADTQNDLSIESFVRRYEELAEEFYCPSAEELFSLGYKVTKDYGYSINQIHDGLKSAFPTSLSSCQNEIVSFAKDDRMNRDILAKRFSDYLFSMKHQDAEYIKFEYFLAHPPKTDSSHGIFQDDFSKTNYQINQTIECFFLSSAQLLEFEIFDAADLEDENYVLLLVNSRNEVNLSLIDADIAFLLKKDDDKNNLKSKLTEQQLDFLIEIEVLLRG